MPETVSNTSPLQYMHQAGVLTLLPELYGRIIIPESVVAELKEGLARGVALPELSRLPWVEVRSAHEKSLLPMAAGLGPGEREALALAVESPGSLLIMDDALGRKRAGLLGVRVTGTLGVLLKAKRAGCLGAVLPIVDKLRSLGFRLRRETRAAVLELAGESELTSS